MSTSAIGTDSRYRPRKKTEMLGTWKMTAYRKTLCIGKCVIAPMPGKNWIDTIDHRLEDYAPARCGIVTQQIAINREQMAWKGGPLQHKT